MSHHPSANGHANGQSNRNDYALHPHPHPHPQSLPPSGYRPSPPNVQQQQQQQYNHNQYNHNPPRYQAAPSTQYGYNNQQNSYWNPSPHAPMQNAQHTTHPNVQASPRSNVDVSAYGTNGYENGPSNSYQHPYPAQILHQPPPPPPPPPRPQQQQQQQQQQQYQPAQFISPSQLFNSAPLQSMPVQKFQMAPSNQHSQNVSPAFLNPTDMGAMSSTVPEPDMPSLLIALAEEYFAAAHQHAPTTAHSKDNPDTDAYDHLITTGLGCLATAIKNVKMSPRVEAQVRLRYAGVLFEETNNDMEAELTLTEGISLCERNRYEDLKYAMQFLLAQFLAKNNPKAALKALDSHAIDAQTFKHFSWVYAFRFLRASYSLGSRGHVDIHAAVQNLRGIAALALQQKDHTIHMAASLLEAMAYMKSTAADATQSIQSALARAWSNQTNVKGATQLIGLAHFIQVACSIREGDPADMWQKLQRMQAMMDATINDGSWSTTSDTVAIPINRMSNSSQTVSHDTRMVLGIGADGRDNLMLSFLSQKDAYSMNYLLCGIVCLHRNPADRKAMDFLEEGVRGLKGDTEKSKGIAGVLTNLLAKAQWRGRATCYMRLYLAFRMAIIGEWKATKIQLEKLSIAAKEFDISLEDGILGMISLYLKGALLQGTGQFDAALQIYEHKKFDLSRLRSSNLSLSDSLERDVCVLAALNRIMVFQVDGKRSAENNNAMLQSLQSLCATYPSKEIQTAYHLVLATIKTNPEAQIFEVKKNLRAALHGSQATGNQLFVCITLNVMCSKFFTGVVGSQSEKSAKAAAATAAKTGNLLWRSVAEGALGRCYEVQGKTAEGRDRLYQASTLAQRAFPDM